MKRNKIQAIALTLILMGSVFVGVGTQVERASATHECSGVDMVIGVFSAGAINKDKCGNNHVSHVVQEMNENDAEQEKIDIYNSGIDLKAQNDVTYSVVDNYANDAKTAAWGKAEAAMVAAMQNNSTKTEVRNAGYKAIEDYYSVKQINTIASWNNTVNQIEIMANVSQSETNVSRTFVNATGAYSSAAYWRTDADKPATYTVTLANGSTYVQDALIQTTEDPINDYKFSFAYELGDMTNWANTNNPTYVVVKAPSSEYSPTQVFNITKPVTQYRTWVDQNQQMKNNVDPWVNSTYSEYEAGNISFTDFVSASTLAQEYGNKWNETGYYQYAIAYLASNGLDTPALNGTGTMMVSYNGETYEGLVMSQNAPNNNTWETNVAYNPANIKGTQFLVTTNGSMVEMTDTFTITEMTDKDGNNIDSTTTKEYTYQTTNTTEYEQMQEDLADLRQEIEDREPVAQTTGGDGSGSIIPAWLQETYFNVPLYGWAIVVMLLAYLANAVRGN